MKQKAPRKPPDFAGTSGELVSLEGLELRFGNKKVSPYDRLLDQLLETTDAAAAAGKPAPGLKFASTKARASVYVQAKKKGFKVSFAEDGSGALYVRVEGRVDMIEKRAAEVKKLLSVGPSTTMVITSKLRQQGDETVDAQGIQAMLEKLAKVGEVVRQEGNSWKLLARKAS